MNVDDLGPGQRPRPDPLAEASARQAPRYGRLLELPNPLAGRTAGALVFARDLRSLPYDEDDLALAVDVAQRVALAVDNAELLARTAEEAQGHREALDQIVATEARYRALLDTSPIPVAVVVG